jgi:hypothetical protein
MGAILGNHVKLRDVPLLGATQRVPGSEEGCLVYPNSRANCLHVLTFTQTPPYTSSSTVALRVLVAKWC